jgi:hypothetical protein
MLKRLLNKLFSSINRNTAQNPKQLTESIVIRPFENKTDQIENLIPIEGEPNHFLVLGSPRPGKRILDRMMDMNSISKFGLAPDEALIMLSEACNYRLTDEQASIAKLSAMELLSSATNDEITIRELVNLWQDTPALSDFADSLRKYLLPG